MQVILVHPPHTSTCEAAGHADESLAPPWELVCLHAFLRARTGHVPHLVDARLFSDFEREFSQTLQHVPGPRLLVVHARALHLAEAMAVVETAHRHAPDLPVALCGPFASAAPDECIALPHVSYALAGDPEPILRGLLDALHAPNRLRQIPGLHLRGVGGTGPAWLTDLSSLPAPTWDSPNWIAYRSGVGGGVTAELCVSRGHTGAPADRAIGGAGQPLRLWPFDRIAPLVQKCAHKGATELHVADPPGLWTPDRLRAWCAALVRTRNTHPWSFRCLPRQFSAAEIADLVEAGCRRVEFILPSCDPDLLRRYECLHEKRRLAAALQSAAAGGLGVRMRIWVGGPEERAGEAVRITRMLGILGHPAFVPQPFPFAFDAPLARDREAPAGTPTLGTWLAWAREPWLHPRPVPAWGGEAGEQAAEAVCRKVVDDVLGNPVRRWRRWWNQWRHRSLIDNIETRMIALFQRPGTPPGAEPPLEP